MKKSLFIFRRDLRFQDNSGLKMAAARGSAVIPCFIIDPQQVSTSNPYRSLHALQCMVESLKELDADLRKRGGRLYLFHGTPLAVVSSLIQAELIDAIYVNKDYTPYSRERDLQLETIAHDHTIGWHSLADALLVEPELGLNASGKPYHIFTPFFNKNRTQEITMPFGEYPIKLETKPIAQEVPEEFLDTLVPNPLKLHTAGGRSAGIALIEKLPSLHQYAFTHDIPSIETSNLSAHLKFGTISVRECYHAIAKLLSADHPLIRQLYWRDFFYHIAWHYPHVFGHPFQKQYESLEWSANKEHFQRWCEGTTGFPIVDAGMRQMNETGFMHNRVRMIVGSFLIKDLHINWLWGEKYFAQQLEDYDPAVNNGNWQWVASTGADHQPYFRIFNPWLQQKKFDPDCIYIKKWVPELRNFSTREIMNHEKSKTALGTYPAPMVEHKREAARALEIYKKAKAGLE